MRHNSSQEKFTKSGVPWIIIWSTNKKSRSEAVILETKLKNLSRKRTIEFILKYKDGLQCHEAEKIIVKLLDSKYSSPDES
jgi:putative endonuclease